jgi:O-antigen ligase
MITQLSKKLNNLNSMVLQIVFSCGVGIALGSAANLFSPLWILALLIGSGFLVIALKRPELFPLALLILTSTVSNFNQSVRISIGFGTLYLSDAMLLIPLGLIILRWLVEPGFKLVRTPLDWPLILFWCMSMISTLISITGQSQPWKQSLGEIRVVTNYFMFFVITNLIRHKGQLTLLIRGILFLATIVALTTITQYMVGKSFIFLAGRVEALISEGKIYSGVVRIIPPGQSIILVAFTIVFTSLVLDRAGIVNVIRLMLCGILGIAIIMTFFRAAWVVTGLAMIIVALLLRREERQRFVVWGLVAVLLLSVIIVAVMEEPESRGAGLVHAAYERIRTLTKSATYENPESSLRWRDFEYVYALPHISSNPFIGLGLGAKYRPYIPGRDNEEFDGRGYIHNGHIWIMLKSGFFAYLGFLFFSLKHIFRGFRLWRQIPDSNISGVVLAFTIIYVGVLIVSIVEPYIMAWSWTPILGIIAGINEVALQRIN